MGNSDSNNKYNKNASQLFNTKKQLKLYIIPINELKLLIKKTNQFTNNTDIDLHINNDIIFKSLCVHWFIDIIPMLIKQNISSQPSDIHNIIEMDEYPKKVSICPLTFSMIDVIRNMLYNIDSDSDSDSKCIENKSYDKKISIILYIYNFFGLQLSQDDIHILCQITSLKTFKNIDTYFQKIIFDEQCFINVFRYNNDLTLLYHINNNNITISQYNAQLIMRTMDYISIDKYKLLVSFCEPPDDININNYRYIDQLKTDKIVCEWFLEYYKNHIKFQLMFDTLLEKLQKKKFRCHQLIDFMKSIIIYLNDFEIDCAVDKINLNYKNSFLKDKGANNNPSYDIILYSKQYNYNNNNSNKYFNIYSCYNDPETIKTDNIFVYDNKIFKYNFNI